jgi:tRNA (mo5U34)-methyltransferase
VGFWWHHIDLGHGIVTPGHQGASPGANATRETLDRIGLPADLSGKTVLDVGAWDGFFSFEVERRGAERVLATDRYVWEHPDYGMDGFLTAREILGSRVEHQVIDVFDIGPETVGTFDVTLFLGVFYHLKNPLLALERLAAVTRELIIVESHVEPLYAQDVPLMRFYEGAELHGDPTNWWAPNPLCLQQAVRAAGFPRAEVVHCTLERHLARERRLRRRLNPFHRPRPHRAGRAVVHGHKQA